MEEMITMKIDEDCGELYFYLKGYFDALDFQQSLKALNVASMVHANSRRDDGKPYLLHPLSVTEILLKMLPRKQLSDNLLASAVLHDVVEEGGNKALKESNFPSDILDTIGLLSKNKGYSGEQLHDYFCKIAIQSGSATLIKAADRLHNIQSIYTFSTERMRKYIFETRTFVLPMLKNAVLLHSEYASEFSVFYGAIASHLPAMEEILKFKEKEVSINENCIDARTHHE